jgi:hypothetical protein
MVALGIDASEITTDAGAGKIHLYAGTGGATTIQGGGTLSASTTLTASATKLSSYDLTLFGCEGATVTRTVAAAQNLVDYTTAGGRLLLTHYESNWFTSAPAPWPSIGTFNPGTAITALTVIDSVDSTSPEGSMMSSWLTNVGASTTAGQISVDSPRAGCTLVDGTMADTLLVLDPALNPGTAKDIQAFEASTPLGGASCGRIVYSDLHFIDATTSTIFPTECVAGPISPAQLGVLYLVLQLGACSGP